MFRPVLLKKTSKTGRNVGFKDILTSEKSREQFIDFNF